MVDYEKEFETPGYAMRQTAVARTFKVVYGWMAAGLALSGVVAWYTFASGLWQKIVMGPWMTVCIVAEIGLVILLSAVVNKVSAWAALAMFIGYAALNGLTLSVVFVVYKLSLVQHVFFITAGMFAGLALWGTFTRNDLSGIGAFCGMALWGVIIASLVNIFVGSSGLDWIISFAGIIVFTGLTMYDAQKIRQLAANEGAMDSSAVMKVGIIGALALYLDFINLFLSLLRLFGRER